MHLPQKPMLRRAFRTWVRQWSSEHENNTPAGSVFTVGATSVEASNAHPVFHPTYRTLPWLPQPPALLGRVIPPTNLSGARVCTGSFSLCRVPHWPRHVRIAQSNKRCRKDTMPTPQNKRIISFREMRNDLTSHTDNVADTHPWVGRAKEVFAAVEGLDPYGLHRTHLSCCPTDLFNSLGTHDLHDEDSAVGKEVPAQLPPHVPDHTTMATAEHKLWHATRYRRTKKVAADFMFRTVTRTRSSQQDHDDTCHQLCTAQEIHGLTPLKMRVM